MAAYKSLSPICRLPHDAKVKHEGSMRFIILAAALLGACSKQPAAPGGVPAGNYVGAGRDALCIAGEGTMRRAGIIVYGEGDRNCSVSGKLEANILTPMGDPTCRIPVLSEGDTVTLGTVPAACEYYCGYDKKLSGERFRLDAKRATVTDLAGDPLC